MVKYIQLVYLFIKHVFKTHCVTGMFSGGAKTWKICPRSKKDLGQNHRSYVYAYN